MRRRAKHQPRCYSWSWVPELDRSALGWECSRTIVIRVATVTSRRNGGQKMGFRTSLPLGLVQVHAMQRFISIQNICCLGMGDRQPFAPKIQQDGNERVVSSVNWCVRSSVKLVPARHGAHTCGPSTQEVEAGWSLLGSHWWSQHTWHAWSKLIYIKTLWVDSVCAALPIRWRRFSLRCRWVQGQPKLHSKA